MVREKYYGEVVREKYYGEVYKEISWRVRKKGEGGGKK